VTGALGLIGREHCRALAEAGANVVAVDLDEDAGFIEELQDISYGSLVKAASIDITDRNALESLRDTVSTHFGSVDILVNNAAVNDMFENPAAAAEESRFEHYPLAMWQRAIDVNITGSFLCAQVFGAVMERQSNGSIINVASTYGMVAPDQSLYRKPDGSQDFYKSPVYPVTKGAIISFTKFLAAYWGGKGIRVNTLSPGGVENGQDKYFIDNYSKRTPLGRMAKPWDYKGALVFLASDASAYMTGANLVVDGGWTCW